MDFMVHYRVHKSSSLVPVLKLKNPVHASPHPISWRAILIWYFHLCLGLPGGLFFSSFLNKTLYAYPVFPIRPTCTAHLILLLLDSAALITLGEQYCRQAVVIW